MTYSEDLLKRYIGVHNLAEQSSEAGERATAGRLRGQLEEKYPGLGLEALRWDDNQRRAKTAQSAPPPPHPSPPPPNAQGFANQNGSSDGADWWARAAKGVSEGLGGNSSGWGEILGTAFKAAQGFTNTVINAEAGKQFADATVKLEEGRTKAGFVRLVASVHYNDLLVAKSRLNDTQKQAFARAVGDRITARLYAFLIS